MKNTSLSLQALLAVGLISSSSAALVTAAAGSAPGTDGYTWNLALDPADSDTSTFSGTVGSWSWEDASLGLGNGIGWRHQSDWIAVTLAGDSSLDISMSRNDNVADDKLFPSFTVYRNLTAITSSHFFENNANLTWDTNLIHEGHFSNSTLGSVSHSMNLPAGDYTIVLGGNATSEATAVNVNYDTTLTATPTVIIPEPSTTLLSLLAGLGCLARRNRK